jgi:sulfate permease, SulP family
LQGFFAQSASVIKALLAGLIIGTMTVVFTVSKATLIFSGELAPFLSQGIGLVLIGATVMATIAVFSVSCRSVIVQPQDVTAVLLATTIAGLTVSAGLAPEQGFATVVVLIGLTTFLAGLTCYGIGHLKLGFIIRYVPRQVTAGFLAASGLLLVREAFKIVVADSSAWTAPGILLRWPQWLPWFLLGLVLAISVRRWRSGFVVPLVIALSAAAFYLALQALGMGVDAARDSGWLLGPFPSDTLLRRPAAANFQNVNWQALAPAIPMMLAVMGLCLLGALLNVVSLELLSGREADLNGALKTLGLANSAAGLVGGLPGYHMVGMTGMAKRIGMPDITAGLSVAAMSALCLVFGASLLSDLPRGLVAGVIWYLGFDLLLAALWDYGRRIPWRDKALVTVIPLVAVTLGVLPALALGLVAACLLFVFVYAQIDVVRLFTTAAHLKARVERSPQDREHLSRFGERTHVYKLSGFLFFGTTQRLLTRLQDTLQGRVAPHIIVLDLKRIVGLDLSAWDAFERLSRRCAEQSVTLMLTGLSVPLRQQFAEQLAGLQHRHVQVTDDLDGVLAALEEQNLAQVKAAADASDDATKHDSDEDVIAILQRQGEQRHYRAGETVMREGATSDSIMVLLSGQLDVSVDQGAAGVATLNRLLPGALFGEVGFYSQRERSASVVAAQDSTVLVVSAQRLEFVERNAPTDASKLHRALARVVANRLIAATLLLKDADI